MLRLASKPWDEKRLGRRLVVQKLSDVGVAFLQGPCGLLTWRPQFHGTLQDASITGIQLLSERPLPARAAVTLWIKAILDNRILRLKLCGDVAWTRPEATGKCMVGIHFRPTPRAAMELWRRAMLEKMRAVDRAEME